MRKVFGTKYYTIVDLEKEFNKTKATIYRWMKEGKLKGIRCGNTILFTLDDIESFIQTN